MPQPRPQSTSGALSGLGRDRAGKEQWRQSGAVEQGSHHACVIGRRRDQARCGVDFPVVVLRQRQSLSVRAMRPCIAGGVLHHKQKSDAYPSSRVGRAPVAERAVPGFYEISFPAPSANTRTLAGVLKFSSGLEFETEFPGGRQMAPVRKP